MGSFNYFKHGLLTQLHIGRQRSLTSLSLSPSVLKQGMGNKFSKNLLLISKVSFLFSENIVHMVLVT